MRALAGAAKGARMCGIVGYTGKRQALPFLLDGLRTLEYRGYDSAGVELEADDGELAEVKCRGRVAALAELCSGLPGTQTTGIAHTRWATHGEPSDANAHPHRDCSGRFAVVHNGIIENYQELKAELEGTGHSFKSETDTEIIAHLVEEAFRGPAKGSLETAVGLAAARMQGSWAIACVSSEEPGAIVCARKGSPLVLASTDEGAYAASDVTALSNITSRVINLEEGQLARLEPSGKITVYNADLSVVAEPDGFTIDWDASAATIGGYPDFMAKEIAEQPAAIERLLEGRLGPDGIVLDGLSLPLDEVAAIDRIYIVACGTSWHVGLLARTYIERWANIPCVVECASEFNYEEQLVSDHTLCVIITQSGETADTLASARKMHARGAKVIAITNVLGSTAARESDGVIYVQAGPEIAVASTKAYTAQLVAAALLALFLAKANGSMPLRVVRDHYREMLRIPELIRIVLSRAWQDEVAARAFTDAQSSLFLGRGVSATTAREGALKLKEISYLHAEAYPAGEMKHGPIALVEPGYPVVVVVPESPVRDKTISNLQEVDARGACVIALATNGDVRVAQLADYLLLVPPAPEWMSPIVDVVHLQMLARYVALARGCDVDKPRNLAKSVTVE